MNILLTDKYKPTKIKDIIGNKNNIKIIIEWLKLVKIKKANKYILLLHGPPGIGKTTIINIILKELNFNIIEFNSSNLRKQKDIKNIISKVLYYKNVMNMLIGTKKENALILDEFDSMFINSDKGGGNELLNIIKRANDKKNKSRQLITTPIICIYNDFSDNKLNEFKKYAIDIKFNKPSFIDLEIIIDNIILNEKIIIDTELKYTLINNSSNDIRRMIILLHDLTINKKNNKVIKNIDILEQNKIFDKKNINIMVYDIVKLLFNKKLDFDTVNFYHSSDMFFLPLLLHENYPNIIFNNIDEYNIKKKTLCIISNNLCYNNIIEKFIKINNRWNFINYSSFYSSYLTNYYIHKLSKNIKDNNIINVNSSVLLNKISNKYLKIYTTSNKISKIFEIKNSFNLNINDINNLSKIFNYIIYNKDSKIQYKLKYYIEFYNFSIDNILFILKQKSNNKVTKKITKLINTIFND